MKSLFFEILEFLSFNFGRVVGYGLVMVGVMFDLFFIVCVYVLEVVLGVFRWVVWLRFGL